MEGVEGCCCHLLVSFDIGGFLLTAVSVCGKVQDME